MPAVAQALAAEKPKLGYQKAYGRVQKWKERGVSESGVLFLERLSGVHRTKLRPDIYA